MKSYRFNKIVRDNIIPILEEKGVKVTCAKVSSPNMLIDLYKEKLQEEVLEVDAATGNDALIEELADCLEVIYSFANILGVDSNRLEEVRKAKALQKGGFLKGDVVDFITLPEEHPFTAYYQANEDKYPEIIPTER